LKIDGFAKSLKSSSGVIPAKAGIQYIKIDMEACLRRACPCEGRGRTEFWAFYEFVKIEQVRSAEADQTLEKDPKIEKRSPRLAGVVVPTPRSATFESLQYSITSAQEVNTFESVL
jgi:hypothetical protein